MCRIVWQEIKIFAGRFSTSLGRQVFHRLFRGAGRFWNSIARPPNLWPEIRASAGTIDLQAGKQMLLMHKKNVREIRRLSAARRKDSLEISNLDRIFSAAGRRSNVLLKIAFFCGSAGVVGGISPFSLEMEIVSRKFKRIAGNPPKSRNFSARAESFRSSAEVLNLQPESRNFGCSFDFPADDFVFRRRPGFSAELFNFPEMPSTVR
jgi:hypothetical protein